MGKNPKKVRARAKKAAAQAVPEPAKELEEDEMDEEEDEPSTSGANAKAVFRPGVHEIPEGEVLDYDRTAYDCMHKWSLDWPCLSFDIVRDSLGAPRSAFPHTAYLMAGTQAAPGKDNYISVMKMAELSQGEHGKKDESDDDMDDDSDEDEDVKETAKFHYRTVGHKGAINRIRCMHQQPGIVATWGDTGNVSVTNLSHVLTDLGEEAEPQPSKAKNMLQVKPMQVHKHSAEGYGLAWSPVVVGALASGDCTGKLHTWEPREGGSWAVSGSAKGHGGSVEDVEWSPTEGTVLATACIDKMVRIYDTRDRSKAQLVIAAHDADVNVISWNALTSYMLASGGDDGALRIWDLRALPTYVANFTFHKQPITSVEWCPQESSMLATCSEDNTLAVWDLALERDPEEEAQLAPVSSSIEHETPPQLLFLHAGQKDMKELHWHRQIPGLLCSTAEDCFNMFKPANIFELNAQAAV